MTKRNVSNVHEEYIHISLLDRDIAVALKRTRKLTGIRLTIDPVTSKVTLTLGRLVPIHLGRKFVLSKSAWLSSKLDRASKINPLLRTVHTANERARLTTIAESVVLDRLKRFNLHYKATYHKVSIKNQKTKWGSCSNRKNLSFNYKIALLPPEFQDYLVVHELCHLKEFNHGSGFWSLVGERIADYKTISRKLRVGDF